MKKEQYFCDKCKEQVGNYNDLFKLFIQITDRSSNFCYDNEYSSFEVCEHCAKKIGITRESLINSETDRYKPDIKERLYDAFLELIETCCANRQ